MSAAALDIILLESHEAALRVVDLDTLKAHAHGAEQGPRA